MASQNSPADQAFNAVVRDAITAVLKPAGFRKTGMNFHRRRGSCVQVVNIQGSMGSSREEKRFYVNVGLAFDDLCQQANLPILETPKEYECDARGTRARLEQLVESADEHWTVGVGHDEMATTDRLRSAMLELIAELDPIDGTEEYRSHRWSRR